MTLPLALAFEQQVFTDLDAAIAHARLHADDTRQGPATCVPAPIG